MSEQPPPPGYGYQSGGYPSSSSGPSLDLSKVVLIGAWLVIGMFTLSFLYKVSQDDYGEEFADRLFGLVPELGTGIFYGGLLMGVSVWLSRNS